MSYDLSMLAREKTKIITIGDKKIGGSNHVLIQSMCNIKTSNVKEVSEQINRCAALGAEAMRVSVLDFEDAKAIKEIKKLISIPLIADIHIDHRLALESIDSGADAIRINPGNIGNIDRIKEVVSKAKEKNIPIRIGVNSGSLDKNIYDGDEIVKAKYLVESAKKHVSILESLGFNDIVISIKGSSAIETIESYRLASKIFPYPLHLGITEAGPKDFGLIRSAAGLSPLLLEGIGDTIRISLSDEPEEEIKAACRLLHDLGLMEEYPTFISCPTCGRTQVDLLPLSKRVSEYLEINHINKVVAIMGCVVNGPGEAKRADIGIAGGKGEWVLFKKGQIIRKIKDENVYDELIKEIEKL